jgi:hypothetical protein
MSEINILIKLIFDVLLACIGLILTGFLISAILAQIDKGLRFFLSKIY